MEFALLGWPDEGPTLRLDYRTFSYAGKFVMSTTGKAVVRDLDVATDPPSSTDTPSTVDPSVFQDDVRAAVAFNEDRTDPGVLWLRYVTVHQDYRGEGLAPRLAAFLADRAEERGYRRLRIAVNNPFAYHAMYKAGFAYTGRQTGLAELVLERPGEPDRPTYQCGLDVFRERDLSDDEREFLAAKERADPPAVVDAPTGVDASAGADTSPPPITDSDDSGI
jgi:GNAT superfamily N-acetyltransferase